MSKPKAKKVSSRRTLNPILMSEDASKFREDFNADQCIAELRRIAEANPDKVISRNFFRVHSEISEATWNRYFGTFHEFKRQANIQLSRAAHALEKTVAVHASRDAYRSISQQRMGYEDTYRRPKSGKYKTMVYATDLHDKECDPFLLRVLIDTVRRVQPDVTCLGGDVFDCPEFGKYTVDPRDWDVVGRITHTHEKILKPLRDANPDGELDIIEGNHEGRVLKLLADATPAMRVLLADLHGFTIAKLFGLDRFEVNYIARSDLAAFNKTDMQKELAKNYKVYWNSLLIHHFPFARSMGMPGLNGHHHKHQCWQMFNQTYGAYEWHQSGAGHRRAAEYCEGERWGLGFALAHVNTESLATNFEYIPVTDFAVVGGRYYERTKEEGAGNVAVWPGR